MAWIARDKSGRYILSSVCPKRNKVSWDSLNGYCDDIHSFMAEHIIGHSLSWEDEPVEIGTITRIDIEMMDRVCICVHPDGLKDLVNNLCDDERKPRINIKNLHLFGDESLPIGQYTIKYPPLNQSKP